MGHPVVSGHRLSRATAPPTAYSLTHLLTHSLTYCLGTGSRERQAPPTGRYRLRSALRRLRLPACSHEGARTHLPPSHTFSHLLTPSHTFSHLLTSSRTPRPRSDTQGLEPCGLLPPALRASFLWLTSPAFEPLLRASLLWLTRPASEPLLRASFLWLTSPAFFKPLRVWAGIAPCHSLLVRWLLERANARLCRQQGGVGSCRVHVRSRLARACAALIAHVAHAHC